MEFDVDKLIFEIANRPSLQNKKLKEYGDRILKMKMCVEIIGGKEMPPDTKKKLGNLFLSLFL